jgi:membrane protease YdiL (CAAX protease family)
MKDQVPGRRGPAWSVLAVFFAIIFAGAMVLGPLLYAVVHPFLPLTPFHRVMDRALMLSAVAALALFWPRIRLAEWWPLGRPAIIQVAIGCGLAFVSAQLIIGLDLALCGFTSAHLSGSQLAARIGMALLAALLVPLAEETVFRGFILGELASSIGRRWGCVVAALIFMLAHFLKIPESLDGRPVYPGSGIASISAAFVPVVHGNFLGWRGLNLFLLGLILGGVFLRTGTLWLNAGLHGGLILAMLLFSGLTRPAAAPGFAFFAGNLDSTPLTSLVLMMLAAWLWRYYPPPSDDTPGSGENAP